MLFFKTSIVSFILACFFCFVAGSPLPDTNAGRLARGLPPAPPKFGRYLPGKRATGTRPPSPGTSPVPPGTCDETAYGYVPGSPTFISLGIGSNWGWVIQGSTPITGTLYAGAGGNDLSKGTIVGTFSITHVGTNLVVAYSVNAPYHLASTHFFYGTTYPNHIAPGQFGNTHDNLPSGTTSDSFTLPFDAAKTTYIVHAAISC